MGRLNGEDSSNDSIVNQFYEAMHSGDVAALVATLGDGFIGEVSEGLPGGNGGTHVGRDHMLRYCWAPVHRTFNALPRPGDRINADDGRVVVMGDYHGTSPRTREPFTAAFVHIFSFVDGRIAKLRQVTDTRRWPPASAALEVVNDVFDAVRARDLDALLRAYSDDIVIREDPGLPYDGVHRGREGATEHSIGFATTWDPYQASDERDPAEVLVGSGSKVVALWRLRARRHQERLDQATVSIFSVAAGEVVDLEMFHADTHELRSFLKPDDPSARAHPPAPE